MTDFIIIKGQAINVASIKRVGLFFEYQAREYYFRLVYTDDTDNWDVTWTFNEHTDGTESSKDNLKKKIESERLRLIQYLVTKESMNLNFFGEINLTK